MKQFNIRLLTLLLCVVSWSASLPMFAQDAVRHTLSVVANPTIAGTFNTDNAELEAGETIQLLAYAKSNFSFKEWQDSEGNVIARTPEFEYTMPDCDVTLTATYEYNPANPENPVKNYWDAVTGVAIVDDFKAGSLSSAVSTAIKGSKTTDLLSLTVAGQMTQNDYSVINSYANCAVFDISRVTGVTEVPSYAFDYTKVESVYLPASIEKMGYRAFYQCKQLTSLTVYAMVPPAIDSSVFSGIQEGIIVYVPAAAIAQYQDDANWQKFTILPVQDDVRNLTVSLPEGAAAADFAQMWLELTNTKNGQKLHYVLTDRSSYTFANIIRNTSWNAVLRNLRGDVFGRIDGIEVKNEDVNVTFSQLSRPQNVSVAVMTPEGRDVTTQTQITWVDAEGNYLAQSNSLSGLPAGYTASYRVALPQELAMLFVTPEHTECVVNETNNRILCQLAPIPQVTLTGQVKDLTTKTALRNANVSASQTFGGRYSKTVSTKTDVNGCYSLTVSSVPTTLAVSAFDYISQTIVCDTLMTGAEMAGVPDVLLKGITGAVITLNLTYTKCPTGAEDDETFQEWYSDYNNVGYSIYNRTKQCAISQYNVQYPQIVLLEEVSEGDMLELTATSKTGAFMPIVTTATIDAEQRANAAFNIVELGKIQATFVQNSNASVVGILYDAKGKLVKSYDYTNASLTVSNLADGSYTLVSMGGSPLFNSIYDLRQLPQTGLVRGSDYVQQSVEVKSGQVTNITIDNVPTLNESALYYTGDNTSFTVNKPSIVAGNYLTLTGNIDFKSAYKDEVSNVNLIVDLPESCSFVEGSVMVGNNTSSYTLQDNRVTIPMTQYTDRVRFCIIPTLGGDYAPSALCQFDIDGESVTQPIGSANYQVKDLSINVPATTAKTTIPVSGTAAGGSTVEIYDGDMIIGQTTTLANGSWSATCELDEAYNLSTHTIHATVATKSGLELYSEQKECTYNKDYIVAKTVDMTFYNGWKRQNVTVTFDLENKTSSSSYYDFYHETDFTFAANLSNNDTTVVRNVTIGVFTNRDGWIYLDANYNEKMDRWVAVHRFGSSNLPAGVKVDFEAEYPMVFDDNIISSLREQLFLPVQNGIQLISEIDSINEGEYTAEEYEEKLMTIIDEDSDNADVRTYEEISSWSDEELEEQLRALEEPDFTLEELNDEISGIRELFSKETDYICDTGNGIIVKSSSCLGLTTENLIDLGFEEYVTTTGKIYVLRSELKNVFVDFSQDLYIEISKEPEAYAKAIAQASALEDGLDKINSIIDKINSCYQPIAKAYEKTEKLLGDLNLKFDNMLSSAMAELPKAKTRYNMKLVKLQRLEKELASMTTLDANYYLKQLQVDSYRQEVKAAKSILDKLNTKKAFALIAVKLTKPIPKLFTKNIPLKKYADVIYDGVKVVKDFQKLYLSIPDPCENEQAKADNCKSLCVGAAVFCEGVVLAKAGASALLDFATIDQLVAAAGTGGVSVLTAIATVIVNIGGNLALDFVSQKEINRRSNQIKRFKDKLKCKDDKCPNCKQDPCICTDPCPECGHKKCICCVYCRHYPCICEYCSLCGLRERFCICTLCEGGCGNRKCKCKCRPDPPVTGNIDPSGFVYEGVFSNRLSGVTATCFYKEMVEDMYGDLHENIVKWNAEEYAQENPLFTDENGYYRWDVPQGLWQVKFEKEGYETTYSEWLPVPPPQLDVNIAMTQVRQPEVKSARAYEDAVEVEFDKYMIPATLTEDNIYVTANGKKVEGTILLLNEEVSYEGKAEKYASKIRFNANAPFAAKEVTLTVANRVKSYAGIQMQESFSQTFDVEQEVKSIETEANITVTYNGDYLLTVKAMPAAAAAGKTLLVRSSSSMIATSDAESYVLNKKGEAQVLISGELPGTTGITFTIDGYDLSVTTMVNVKIPVATDVVATPTASIASGTTVERGTAVALTCETPDATIYYTLDGSCPCDEETRLVYTAPIVLNESVTIKAMAVAPDMEDSEIAEFSYIVTPIVGIDEVTLDETIKVYPLPVRDKLNVTAGGELIKSVTLVSTNGSVVARAAKPEMKVTLDVSTLAPGIYFINVATEDKKYSRKIMKVE